MFAAVGARAGDVAKGHLRVELCQELREVQCQVVGDVLILFLAHADGGDAEAEIASVVSNQLRLDRREIEEIGMNDFAQFGVRDSTRLSIDGQDLFDIRVVQAGKENTLADHARCSGDDGFDLHDLNGDR